MAVNVTYKPWDSNFFGFKTGEIINTGTAGDFGKQLKQLKKDGYQLLYWKVSPDDSNHINTANLHNIFLGDTKLAFQFNPAPLKINAHSPIQLWNGKITDALIELGIESGQYSRFKNDPLLPSGSFERMYAEWVKQSINGSMGNEIYFIGDKNNVKGFVTLSYLNTHAEIGLIAVDRKHRNSGMGTALVNWAIHKAAEMNFNLLKVITQQQNVAACNLYQKCKGEIINREFIYHIHL